MEILLSKLIALLVYPFGLLFCLVAATTALLLVKKTRAARWFALAALVLLLVAGNGRLAYTLVRSLENDYPPVAVEDAPASDVIIVLGGGLGLPLPPRLYVDLGSSSDRLLEAFRLYRAGKAGKILLSGGNGYDMFVKGSDPRFLGTTISAITVEALEELGTVSPEVDGRITVEP
mgnify:CR=1 FL=1